MKAFYCYNYILIIENVFFHSISHQTVLYNVESFYDNFLIFAYHLGYESSQNFFDGDTNCRVADLYFSNTIISPYPSDEYDYRL